MATNVNMTQAMFAGAAKAFDYRLAPLATFSPVVYLNGHFWGDSVTVPFVPAASASIAWTGSTGYASDSGDVQGKQVTLSGYRYIKINVSDNEFQRYNEQTISNLVAAAANRLAYDVQKDILSATSSFSNFTVSSGSLWATTAPVDLSISESNRQWTDFNKSLIVTPELKGAFLRNNTNVLAYAIGESGAVKEGKISRYYAHDVYETDTCPSTVKGLAVTPNAFGVAMAYAATQPDADYIRAERIDTPSGLVMGYVEYYDKTLRTKVRALDCLWGKTVLDPNAGFNLLVTDINK